MRSWFAVAVVTSASLMGAGAAHAAAPPNDDYAAATPIGVGQEVQGNNLDATSEPGEKTASASFTSSNCLSFDESPDCGTSVWYALQPLQSGEYTVETCDMGTDMPAGLAVYSGESVGTASLVDFSFGAIEGCGGASGIGSGARVSVTLTAGTTYHVGVYGLFGSEGSFYLRDYSGGAIARPSPDTGPYLESSVLQGAGVASGSRHTPSFALTSSPPGASFECSLDGAAFASCDQIVSYEGLAPGSSHVFRARANVHGAIDPTPLVQPFTLDQEPPDTAIASGPSGSTPSREAQWRVASTERTPEGLHTCSFDEMPLFRYCRAETIYKELCQGPHDFSAITVDRAGNPDPTPATAHIDVTAGPACAPPTLEQTLVATYPTQLIFAFKVDAKGAGGRLEVEYGTTGEYGMKTPPLGIEPDRTLEVTGIPYLQPGTPYHYRATLTTPFGSATTGDLMASTKPLKQPLPGIVYGSPTTTPYAASLPAIIDPQTEGVIASVLVEKEAPVTLESPRVFSRELVDSFGGPRTVVLDLTDLDPNTTYHYRVSATQVEENEVLGPEATFTTPPLKNPPPPGGRSHFRLRKGQVRIGKLTRRSREVTVEVHGLPAKTLVTVSLKARKSRAGGRRHGNAEGRVTLRFKLSKKFRRALHDRRVKSVRFKITASPPGDTPSAVVLKRRLGR